MANQDFQKAACAACGGRIEFPADAQGMTIECPHCHQQTELHPANGSTRRSVWGLLGFAAVGVALAVGVLFLLKPRHRNEPDARTANGPSRVMAPAVPVEAAKPKSLEDLKILGHVTVEKAKGSRLSYAMGTLKNDSEHQRFGVKVEIDLFDSVGNKLPTRANDYRQMMEPRQEWKFRALVLEPNAAAARVASINEE